MSSSRVPQPTYPYRHSLDVQLRFNDIDLLGHVNNSVYLQFFDLAKLDYFRAVMGDDFDLSGIAVVIVNINCDFFAPSFIHEQLKVLTTTTKVGDRSMVLEQRIVNADTDEVKCIGRTVMAGFDPKTLASAPIAQLWRDNLSKFEGRSFSAE